MATYTIHATITAEVANTSALDAMSPAGGAGDEHGKIQAAVDAGLKELPGIGSRYGFRVIDASATVEDS